jgi:hypothetical protein
MAKRFTDTELWDKEWFMKLSPKLKCLVKLVRDKADLAGVWSPNWVLANSYIGEEVSEKELLNIDEGNQFAKLENGKIICVDFIQFQYGKLSPASPVHRKIISILATHKIDYQYPINRVQEEDKEEEEEKEKEEEKYKEKEHKKISEKTIIGEVIDQWQQSGLTVEISEAKDIRELCEKILNIKDISQADEQKRHELLGVMQKIISWVKSENNIKYYGSLKSINNNFSKIINSIKNNGKSTQKKSPHKLETVNYDEKF